MGASTLRSLGGILVSLLVAAAVAWAGGRDGAVVGGWPVFALCGALSFTVNWIAFVPAYLAQTEHYYDLTGSLTYVALVAVALWLTESIDARGVLLAVLVVIWAARLGSFLFRRVRKTGADHRFDRIKPDFFRFLMTWTLQGLWVFITLSCALAAITAREKADFDILASLGVVLWLGGFTIEVVADRQKSAFRADPGNRDRFIATGVWAWSRHPNYFGEIVLWLGIALIGVGGLEGWQHATLISPLFVAFLLTRVSGVPMLEARARRKWGGDPEFEAHLKRTPVLIPRPPARS